MTDLIIAGILSLWLLVTLACQIRTTFKKRLKWPDFLLFAPGNGLFIWLPINLYLVWRDRLPDGKPSPWQSISLKAEKKRFHLIWAPQFWRTIHLAGMLNQVVRRHRKIPRDRLPEDMWHRLTVQYINAACPQDQNAERQFRIVKGAGHLILQPPEILYTSEFYRC